MDQTRSTGRSSVSSFPDFRPLPKKSLVTGSARRFQAFLIPAPLRRGVWQPGRLEWLESSEHPHPSEEGIGGLVDSVPGSSPVQFQKLSEENFLPGT
jgi:hypothetical protein